MNRLSISLPILAGLPGVAQEPPAVPAWPAAQAAPQAAPAPAQAPAPVAEAAASAQASAPAPAATPIAPQPPLDEGLLDPAYFGIKSTDFHETKWADFLWVKPGLSLKGRAIQVEWEAPHLLNSENDKLDIETADTFSKKFPDLLVSNLKEHLGDSVAFPAANGTLLLKGRIVGINVRSSMWSYSRDMMTFDLKLVDPASGETVLALHHRLLELMGFRKKGNGILSRTPSFAEEFATYIKSDLLKQP